MAELDERAWADAIGMYERRYTYAKVTGRDHADWALDVDRLMRGNTPDVRGWRVNDPLAGEFERLDDPYYPFALRPDAARTDAWKYHLDEIPRSSAKRFLVALSTLWLNVEDTPEFEERREDLERRAEVILSRFPEGSSRFYANTGSESARLDYYKRISGCDPISVHDWDLGLFLVSDTEVGMVWSFHAW
ncbi:hypothetical protein [Streptomyces sp. TR1341]|uniref:hypothetical protein n=1 Tax=Streptomyces sp. TR1341 TaxID=2601266 RepID=UPI00308405CE